MSRHRHAAVAALATLAGVGRAFAARGSASVRDATVSAQNATATATTAQNATATATQNATATATQNATATGTPSVEALSTAAAEAQTAAAPALEFGTPIAPGVAGLAAGLGLGLVVATAVVYWGVGQ